VFGMMLMNQYIVRAISCGKREAFLGPKALL